MTLHTVEVTVPAFDAVKIFQGLEHRSCVESWQLVHSQKKGSSSEFQIYVDGCDQPTTVTLHSDGTWTMKTHISLGEKL